MDKALVLLTIGSIGNAVINLQKLLNAAGVKPILEVDGHFGNKTMLAVRTFQTVAGLVVDGVAGYKTMMALNKGDTKDMLKDADIIRASVELGIPESSIRAIAQVESLGEGFLSNGKAKILYERHVMHAQLEKKKGRAFADQQAAANPSLVNTKRGGYQGGTAEYIRLNMAMGIDNDSAIEATSWGQFQIMGYHWKALGYKSATDFMQQMQANESNQFDALIKFIKADAKLLKALKDENWEVFASIYNGPAYKDNNYDYKLIAAKRHFVQFDPKPTPAPKIAA